MKPGHALRLVAAALEGRLPPEAEWHAVVETANRGWLGPALYVALARAGRLHDIPPPVREYLAFLHERNCERNRRLHAQLIEAVRVLNAAGIQPILLKGAINLWTGADEDLGMRMLSDLDLSIAPDEMVPARAALGGLGYGSRRARELGRPDDVGVIEFHDRPSPRSARYLSGDLRRCAPAAERDGAVARIPSATARALHLIVHDMIKERDYWSLRIDFRHLHDLATLARSVDGIDWSQLATQLSDPSGRGALVAQGRALEDLFGLPIPPDLRPGWKEELRHQTRLTGAGHGASASLARLIGNVARGAHEFGEGYAWRGGWKFSQKIYRRLAARGSGSRV